MNKYLFIKILCWCFYSIFALNLKAMDNNGACKNPVKQGSRKRDRDKSEKGPLKRSDKSAKSSDDIDAKLAALHTYFLSLLDDAEISDQYTQNFNRFLADNHAVATDFVCFDYAIFHAIGAEEMLKAKDAKIKASETNAGITYLENLGYSFTSDRPKAKDIVIYYDGIEAIHFGVLEERNGILKVISKPGLFAEKIFIHGFFAFGEVYGENINIMRKAS